MSISNNLSSRLLRYVSIRVSLFLGLNIDLGLNFSYGNGFLSFLKCPASLFYRLLEQTSDPYTRGRFQLHDINNINNIAVTELSF